MNTQVWSKVDDFLTGPLGLDDPVLAAALADSEAAGLPPIQVSPPQGKLLHLLAAAGGARRILEIGTLGGYSTIWLARALQPGGRLITLELNPKHAEVARANLTRAGLADCVEVRVGPARDSLAQLHAEQAGPFDLVFIDADKASTPDYLNWALRMTAPGSLIMVDNVVRGGAVTDPNNPNPDVQGIRRALAEMAANPNLVTSAMQTVGGKGYDGFALALVVQPSQNP